MTKAPDASCKSSALSCENCGATHNGRYGVGRYCSVSCSKKVGAVARWSRSRQRSMKAANRQKARMQVRKRAKWDGEKEEEEEAVLMQDAKKRKQATKRHVYHHKCNQSDGISKPTHGDNQSSLCSGHSHDTVHVRNEISSDAALALSESTRGSESACASEGEEGHELEEETFCETPPEKRSFDSAELVHNKRVLATAPPPEAPVSKGLCGERVEVFVAGFLWLRGLLVDYEPFQDLHCVSDYTGRKTWLELRQYDVRFV